MIAKGYIAEGYGPDAIDDVRVYEKDAQDQPPVGLSLRNWTRSQQSTEMTVSRSRTSADVRDGGDGAGLGKRLGARKILPAQPLLSAARIPPVRIRQFGVHICSRRAGVDAGQ